MPDLIQQFTAPAPPPMPPGLPPIPPETEPKGEPPLAATPPTIDPAAWEDFAVFRETFLMYLTPPGYAAALRTVGEMLHTMILESYNPWPGWPESSTRTELRAALADLRHLEGFLGAVGREHVASSLSSADEALSEFAGRQGLELSHIADEIEAALGTGA